MLKKKQIAIVASIFAYAKMKEIKKNKLNNKEHFRKIIKRENTWSTYGRQNMMQMKNLYQMRVFQRNLK